jgi:hypothetical protein
VEEERALSDPCGVNETCGTIMTSQFPSIRAQSAPSAVSSGTDDAKKTAGSHEVIDYSNKAPQVTVNKQFCAPLDPKVLLTESVCLSVKKLKIALQRTNRVR